MKKCIVCIVMLLGLSVVSFAQTPLVDRMLKLENIYEEQFDEYGLDGVPGMLTLAENATAEEINMRVSHDPECGFTALMHAVLHSRSEKVIKALLANGADVALHDCSNRSVLDIATAFWQPTRPEFQLLLDAGVPEKDMIKAARSYELTYRVILEWAEKNQKTELLDKLEAI